MSSVRELRSPLSRRSPRAAAMDLQNVGPQQYEGAPDLPSRQSAITDVVANPLRRELEQLGRLGDGDEFVVSFGHCRRRVSGSLVFAIHCHVQIVLYAHTLRTWMFASDRKSSRVTI